MSVELAVIGGGNMARAIVEGAIRGGVLRSSQVAIADPDDTCRSFFDQLGCVTVQCAMDLPKTKYTLIAVKPQVFDEVASCITSEIIYSIMAGVSTSRISQAIGNECVIRVMPNLPCSMGYGAAGLALGSGATAEDAQLAIELFSAVGSVVEVEEPLMDAVTAVSARLNCWVVKSRSVYLEITPVPADDSPSLSACSLLRARARTIRPR